MWEGGPLVRGSLHLGPPGDCYGYCYFYCYGYSNCFITDQSEKYGSVASA